MDHEALLRRLQQHINRYGPAAAWCEEFGISRSYVCDVKYGRCPPGDKMLEALGLERNPPTYRPKESQRPANWRAKQED